MKKHLGKLLFITIGIIIGSIVTGLLMNEYISSQRAQGYNDGSLDASVKIYDFLKENVKNDTLSKKAIELNKRFTFKYFTLSVVEINGVRTVQAK